MKRRPLERLETVSLIAIGGFAGSNLRYFLALQFPERELFATFLVNVLGSFALAVLVYDSLSGELVHARSRLVFGTGFLSSFTTYSLFALQAASNPEVALLYVGGSYVCGFGAVVLGRLALGPLGGGER